MTVTHLPAVRATAAPAATTFDLAGMAPWDLAQLIHRTDFVPTGLRGRPEAVLACFLYGHEIGVGPMESLANIAVIEGRPAISAQLMRARVLGAGHELWEEDANNTRVTMAGRRAGTDRVQTVTWTLDDARKAGLAGRANWSRYPRQMLEARATAQLCRLMFPDVLGASRYATEELEGGEDPPEAVADVPTGTQAPKKASRRRNPNVRTGAELEALGYEPSRPARTIETTADAAPEPPRPPLPDEPLEVRDVAPDPAPDPGWTSMSDPQRRALFAALREAGITSRDDRLAYCGEILQRPIGSSAELTPGDASAVIEAAHALAVQMRLPGAVDVTDEPLL